MTRLAILCALAAAPAFSDTISISGTAVTLAPSDLPGVVAVVTMDNVQLNGAHDNGVYSVAMPGLVVEVEFSWEQGMWGEDLLTVLPPDGMTCQPASCAMLVPEGLTGRIELLEWVGS